MRALRALLARAAGLFTARRADAELDEELETHLAMQIAESVRRGMSPLEARRTALLASGGIEIAKEAVRARRGVPWLETTISDVRYASRSLARSPGYTALATATLALGIGASTAMFSVVDGVLLRPLPYLEPDRLVALTTFSDGVIEPISAADLMDWRARAGSFSGIAAAAVSQTVLTGSGEPTWLSQARVTANTFDVIGARPLIGRAFVVGEDDPAAPRVALLSERVWRSRFAGDSSVVGRSVVLDGFPTTVVGVAPAEMAWPIPADVWLTTRFSPADLSEASRGARWLDGVARLAPDASPATARVEMNALAEALARADPASSEGVGIRVDPLLDSIVFGAEHTLLILFGAVGVLLLISCANVASLTFGRVAARDAELAMRRALGAGRARIVRQVVIESLLVAVAGGALGYLLAALGLRGLLAIVPPDLPRLGEVALDARVLAFTLATALSTCVLFGLAPALQGPSGALHERLRPVGRGTIRTAGAVRSRRALVSVQVALAVVLLAAAGLLGRSFWRITRVDPGFRAADLVAFGLATPPNRRYPGTDRDFANALLAGLRQAPGVSAAAVAIGLPLSGGGFPSAFEVVGRPAPADGAQPMAEVRTVSSGYFAAMGIPLLRGRLFDERDRVGSGQRVIISRELARLYFPGEDPLGKTLEAGWRMGGRRFGGEVVGVVGDVRQYALNRAPSAHIYMPFEQWPLNEFNVVIRSDADPARVFAVARQVIERLDADTPMSDPETFADRVARTLGSRRFNLTMLGVFAALALTLACVGVYGVIAYSVQQRRSELGVRIALGASRRRVVRLVLLEAAPLVVGGVAAGMLVGLASSRLLEALLFEVGPGDPVTFALAPAALLLVALAACLLPALRAAAVDPAETIRED
jgi:putative ABC transport system permease protein